MINTTQAEPFLCLILSEMTIPWIYHNNWGKNHWAEQVRYCLRRIAGHWCINLLLIAFLSPEGPSRITQKDNQAAQLWTALSFQ